MLLRRKVYLLIVLVLFTLYETVYAADNINDFHYVINVSSSLSKQEITFPKTIKIKYKTYQISTHIKGKKWYRTRIGYFKSKISANRIIRKISKKHPKAWVDKIKNSDKTYLASWLKSKASSRKVGIKRKLKKLSNTQQIKLINKGKKYFIDKKYKAAIPIFRKLFQSGTGNHKQKALELLALSRERNHQLAHALAQYKKYLSLYSLYKESASRVQQRLTALLTARNRSKKSLTKKKNNKNRDAKWKTYGVLFQFYDKDEIDITSSSSSIVSAEQLTTNLSLSGRLVDSEYKIKTQFNAIHGFDLIDSETNDNRVTSLYVDTLSPSKIYSSRSGRQRGTNGGVSGRFDGFDLGYRLTTSTKFNFITGYPVEIHPTVVHQSDKYFNSLGFNIQSENKHLDYSFYLFEQTSDGLQDRYEIGAEFRYITKKQSFIALYDYSLQFKKTNYFISIMNWKFPNKHSLNIYINHRRSPFLATTNALRGQTGVSSLSDLLETLEEDEIEQLSSDRTAISKSSTIKYTIQHTDKIKYQIDYSISSLTGTISTGGAPATSDTGNEYSYAFSYLAKNWLMKNDNYLVRLRNSQLATSNAAVLDLTARYRFNKNWRIGPSYRYDIRDYDDGRDVTKKSLLVRMDYRHSKSIRFQLNVSRVDKYTVFTDNSPQDITDNILHIGYIYLF